MPAALSWGSTIYCKGISPKRGVKLFFFVELIGGRKPKQLNDRFQGL